MFDFLDSDWFIITLEIVFLIFIVFDLKRYIETKKKEYITNIAITIAFFIWASIPFYNSYITWADSDKQKYFEKCSADLNISMCNCIDNEIFKEYRYEEYIELEKNNDKELKDFFEETKKECIDD